VRNAKKVFLLCVLLCAKKNPSSFDSDHKGKQNKLRRKVRAGGESVVVAGLVCLVA